jgi:hypothetical protein
MDLKRDSKRITMALTALFLCASLMAQDAPSGPFAGQVPVNAALKKSLSSRDTKVGQEISATTEKAVTINGTTLAKNTILLGHVVDVTKHGSGSPNGSITVVFDHAQPKKGDPIPIRASIYRISMSDSQIQSSRRDVDMGMRGSAAEAYGTAAIREGSDQDERSVQGSGSKAGAPVRVVSAIPGITLSAVASAEKSGILSAPNHDVDLDSGTELVVGVALK